MLKFANISKLPKLFLYTAVFMGLSIVSTMMESPIYAASGYKGTSFTTPFMFYTNGTSSEGRTTESDTNLSSHRLGHTLESGLYLGAMYDWYRSQENETTGYDQRSMGLSVGYGKDGFFAVGHLILDSQKILHGVANGKAKGSGFGFDLGYTLPIAGSIYMGAQVGLRGVVYQESTSSGEPATPGYTDSVFFPSVVIGSTIE